MTWVRIEDTFCEHPKVEPLGDLAFRLYVKALCYANRNLTDGYVPDVAARAMGGPRHRSATRELIDGGLWELARGGFRIHDFLDFQPERADVLRRRESDRNRRRIQPDSERIPDGIQSPRTHPVPKSLKETGTTKDAVRAVLRDTHLGRMA